MTSDKYMRKVLSILSIIAICGAMLGMTYSKRLDAQVSLNDMQSGYDNSKVIPNQGNLTMIDELSTAQRILTAYRSDTGEIYYLSKEQIFCVVIRKSFIMAFIRITQ